MLATKMSLVPLLLTIWGVHGQLCSDPANRFQVCNFERGCVCDDQQTCREQTALGFVLCDENLSGGPVNFGSCTAESTLDDPCSLRQDDIECITAAGVKGSCVSAPATFGIPFMCLSPESRIGFDPTTISRPCLAADGCTCFAGLCVENDLSNFCAPLGDSCGDYTCTTEGNVPNPEVAADLCTDDCTDEECCIPQTCDTSFGCEEVQGDSCTSPKLNDIEGVGAKRWGWYIEPTFDSTEQTYTFDMYAGAGQNILANGAYAGNVVVTVGSDGSSDYITYPEDGYCFDDIHVHVGNELPTQTKRRVETPTVAPEQYAQTALADGRFFIIVHVGETCTPCGP